MPDTVSQTVDPAHQQALRELFNEVPFAKMLGLTIETIAPGRLTMRFPMRPELGQLLGYAHGGALAGLMDTAASFCWRTVLPIEAKAVAIELKVNFMRPVVHEAMAEAVLEHAGKKTAVIVIRLWDEAGKLACLSTVTYMRIG